MRLGNDRASHRNRGSEVTAGEGVVGKGEIVWTEDSHRGTERSVHRANIGGCVDSGHCPAAIADRRCRLAKLVDGARQLNLNKARRHRQRCLEVRHLREL